MQKRYIFINDQAAQRDKLVIASILVISLLVEIFVPWVRS